MATIKRKSNINIGRVVTKLAVVLITLYAGGIIVDALGDVMNGTCSPFYQGLTLIGWTTGTAVCTNNGNVSTANTITATTGSGILAVIGVLGLASIVLEFVSFKF